MIKENDIVKAKLDLSKNIRKDTEGVILSVYDNGNYFLVEFIDKNSDTIEDGMTKVKVNDIELIYNYSGESDL
jgi:hypothetical protein